MAICLPRTSAIISVDQRSEISADERGSLSASLLSAIAREKGQIYDVAPQWWLRRFGGRHPARRVRATKAGTMSFPNQLSDPKPLRLVLTGAGARLTLLFLLALAPRLWVAERMEVLCSDGVFHIAKAQ